LEVALNRQQIVEWIVVPVLAGCLAYSGLAYYQKHQTAKALEQSLQQERDSQQHALAADTAKATADQLQANLTAMAADVQAMRDQLANLPKDPGPAKRPPQDLRGVAQGLHDMGLQPRVEPDAIELTLGDAGTAWTWGQEAKRVPILLDRLAATQGLATGLQKQADQAQAVAAARSLQADQEAQALASEQQAVGALKVASASQARQLKLAQLPWAVGVSYSPTQATWGAWGERDLSLLRFQATVIQIRAPSEAGAGRTLDLRLGVGFRF
jgi:hypothetical protein